MERFEMTQVVKQVRLDKDSFTVEMAKQGKRKLLPQRYGQVDADA